jgi:aspartate carbamoyltransferase catalytic subunit
MTEPNADRTEIIQGGPVVRLEHLLGLRDLSPGVLTGLLDASAVWRERLQSGRPTDVLRGRVVALVFLEPSTRTRFSFEVAARRLGAEVLAMSAEGSSASKGETLWDTAKTLRAHGADLIVLRHKWVGSPHQLAVRVDVPIVNAGDGIDEHPTQGLLDALTLRDRFGRLDGLTVAIIGDVRHSRVARSNCFALTRLGVRVLLAGPGTLCPPSMSALGVEVRHTIEDVLDEADAIMMLRIQRERMAPGLVPSDEEYARLWGLTSERVSRARPGLVILHPGPMNRGLEIGSEVAAGERSLVFVQKANGVAVRMAVLANLLGGAA